MHRVHNAPFPCITLLKFSWETPSSYPYCTPTWKDENELSYTKPPHSTTRHRLSPSPHHLLSITSSTAVTHIMYPRLVAIFHPLAKTNYFPNVRVIRWKSKVIGLMVGNSTFWFSCTPDGVCLQGLTRSTGSKKKGPISHLGKTRKCVENLACIPTGIWNG